MRLCGVVHQKLLDIDIACERCFAADVGMIGLESASLGICRSLATFCCPLASCCLRTSLAVGWRPSRGIDGGYLAHTPNGFLRA